MYGWYRFGRGMAAAEIGDVLISKSEGVGGVRIRSGMKE